jgi:DNA-binding transcriptional ArsR family regulator
LKVAIQNLNKAFESRIRLGIMSALIAGEGMNFNKLKTLLDVTDGNLASHLKALEKAGYVEFEKAFIGRKTNTTYNATKMGKGEFRAHIDALETLIKEQIGRS